MNKDYFSIISLRKFLSYSIAFTLITAFFICLGFSSNNAFADINVGDILVTSEDGGKRIPSTVLIINPDTGVRTVLTDFSKVNQGPLGEDPRDLVMEPDGNICVIDSDVGIDEIGLLFRIDVTNGTRTVISDFGDPAQGPLGDFPQGIGLFTNGDLYATDSDAPNGNGGLFRVDKITGFRTLVTDLSDIAQGPTGDSARDVAEGPGGTIFLVTSSGGTANRGLLFEVDPVTGFRTVLSDFGNGGQGPTAFPRWLAVPPAGNLVYVVSPAVGNDALLSVNTLTGNRQLISDFDNPAQGPTDVNPQGIAIDSSGQILVNGNPDALFSIDPVTGFRTVISQYDNTAQGPLAGFTRGIIVATVATEMVLMQVPTLSQWGLIAMAGVLGIVGFMVMRRRKVAA